jgi:hypothetical protein
MRPSGFGQEKRQGWSWPAADGLPCFATIRSAEEGHPEPMAPTKFLTALFLLGAAACAPLTTSPPDMPGITELPPLPFEALPRGDEVLDAEEIREDFEELYTTMRASHYDIYARRSQAEYDALYDRMLAEFDEPMSIPQIALLFHRFAAYGNIAHARIDLPGELYAAYRADGGKAVPLYPRVEDGRMFVAESYAPDVPAGAEVTAIEGKPVEYWLERLGRNIAADNPYLLGTRLEWVFPRVLWTELGAVDSVEMTLSVEGRERVVSVGAIDAETMKTRSAETGPEIFVQDGSTRHAEMMEGGIAYLRPGVFYGLETPDNPWDNTAFRTFIDESFETFLENDARALVIDIRGNPGGDNSFSDIMVSWFADRPYRFASRFLVRSSAASEASNAARIALNPASSEGVSGMFAKAYAETPFGETFPFEIPFSDPRDGKRFEGPIYLLIDRHSYSNSVAVAATVKDYGFGTVLGEETSDLATSYGAMETFTLPHSDITVGYPKALIIRPSGDLAPRGVVPDVAIEVPVVAYRDVMLDDALEFVRSELD